jgi:hypothetical protein
VAIGEWFGACSIGWGAEHLKQSICLKCQPVEAEKLAQYRPELVASRAAYIKLHVHVPGPRKSFSFKCSWKSLYIIGYHNGKDVVVGVLEGKEMMTTLLHAQASRAFREGVRSAVWAGLCKDTLFKGLNTHDLCREICTAVVTDFPDIVGRSFDETQSRETASLEAADTDTEMPVVDDGDMTDEQAVAVA